MNIPKIFSDLNHEKLEEMGYSKESYELERVYTSIYDEIAYILKNREQAKEISLLDNIYISKATQSNYTFLKELADQCDMPKRLTLMSNSIKGAIGHNNRKWEALDGNLQSSFLFKLNFDLPFEYMFYPPMLTLASICEAFNVYGIDAKIKLCTDIVVGEKKIGGILANSQGGGKDKVFIMGVGLNINTLPDVIDLKDNPFVLGVTSLLNETGNNIKVLDFFKTLSKCMEKNIRELEYQDYIYILNIYKSFNVMLNKDIVILEDKPVQHGEVFVGKPLKEEGRNLIGELVGFTNEGKLLLNNDGKIIEVMRSCRIAFLDDYLRHK